MTKFTPQEIWGRHIVLLGIHTQKLQYEHFRMFRCHCDHSPQLNESKGDYKDMTSQKPYADRSDKKRIPEFLSKIQAMIDNDQSKSIRFLARDMGKSLFPIRLTANEVIRYFLYKMRKGSFLSRAMKDESKDHAAKIFKK